MKPSVAILALSAAFAWHTAATAAGTYGDDLAARALRQGCMTTGVKIETTGKDGTPVVVSAGDDGAAPRTVRLRNAMGEPIGDAVVSCRCGRAGAEAVAAWLSRRILTPEGLLEAAPFVAGASVAPHAQAIVDRMVARYPTLVTLAMHVAPPGGANAIIASSFGRIGKAADGDDRHVIADGAILQETTNGGRRLAVELPQLDSKGAVIGALSTSFTITPGHDAAAYANALSLRDAIARATPSLAALLR